VTRSTITPAGVRLALLARREIAFLDLREEADYARGHPLFAASLPLGRLELEILDRVPRLDTEIVVYDSDDAGAARGALRLTQLGYRHVRRLAGGLDAWRAAGFELFQDVNSASKAFGELVEHRRRTPSLAAPEVKAMIDGGEDIVILDARRFEEFRTMSIPQGMSVPGAELVLRAREIAPDPSTTIIVNCAGRTRSIIGAQSLINAGLPNRVVALRNGAIGWRLAGLALDQGALARYPAASPEAAEAARASARAIAYAAGVRHVTLDEAQALAEDKARTLYRLDVRPPDEYAAGHLPGFINAPGGQLVQETDVWAPVRGARLLLADTEGARADMTASWLAQMGWEVLVLLWRGEGKLELGLPRLARPPLPTPPTIEAAALLVELQSGLAIVIDLAPSPAYHRGHIPGAWFAVRARLADILAALPSTVDVVLTSPDGDLARLAAAEAAAGAGRPIRVLNGGSAAWTAAGLALEAGEARMACPPDDVYRRPYEGVDVDSAAMQGYLDWEFGLVAQLERDGTHGFFVI